MGINMDEDLAKKIIIPFFTVGPFLLCIWLFSSHVNFMMNAEPAAVKVTHYTFSNSRSKPGRAKSKFYVSFSVVDGPYEGKSHRMYRVPFVKLHKVGAVTPGRYHPETKVAMTNKYARHVIFVNLFFVFLSGTFLWLAVKYRKSF